MFHLLWDLIIKVFLFVLLGWILAKPAGAKAEKVAGGFIWFAVYVLVPLFVFLSIWNNSVSMKNAGNVVVVAVMVLLGGTISAKLWAITRKIPFSRNCLPIIFMNSAYLAIPVNTLLWGAEGTAYAIIYNLVVTIAHFTFGVWWVNPGKTMSEIMGIPVIYAIALGLILNLFSIGPPAPAVKFGSLISSFTLPVMLVFLGYRLSRIKLGGLGTAVLGVMIRMGGGLIVGILGVYIFKLSGPAAGVCIITSSMPAAVNSYILSERFSGDAEFAAAAVSLGTMASILTIPLISYLLRLH